MVRTEKINSGRVHFDVSTSEAPPCRPAQHRSHSRLFVVSQTSFRRSTLPTNPQHPGPAREGLVGIGHCRAKMIKTPGSIPLTSWRRRQLVPLNKKTPLPVHKRCRWYDVTFRSRPSSSASGHPSSSLECWDSESGCVHTKDSSVLTSGRGDPLSSTWRSWARSHGSLISDRGPPRVL